MFLRLAGFSFDGLAVKLIYEELNFSPAVGGKRMDFTLLVEAAVC